MTITDILAAIDEEPECPGEMPEAMYQTILNLDKPAMEEWCRILVRETKQGIRERVLATINTTKN